MSGKINKIVSPKNLREVVLFLIDSICVLLTYIVTILLLNIKTANSDIIINSLIVFPLVIVLYLIFNYVIGVARVIWRYSNLEDYFKLFLSLILTFTVFALFDYFIIKKVYNPSAYIFLTLSVSAVLVIIRGIYAYMYSKLRENVGDHSAANTMIIGAGYTGKLVIDELIRHKSVLKPVCIVDDDSDKKGRAIGSIKIVGNTSEIPKFVKKYDIKKIVFAIPSCDKENRKRILKNCVATDCEIRVLPFIGQMINNVNIMSQAKEVKIEDLLGRSPIVFDSLEITSYVKDKICLVTGGGGSIGSELCRQIAKYSPKKLIILDIYENSAYEIQQELIREYKDKLDLTVEICSVADFDRMELLYKEHKPEIVFHAAAHKHVPLMETNPEEAVKNNVLGTYNMVKLAGQYKVKKFILVSTDKAVNPTNVMGATKRCCEMIIQHFSKIYDKTEYAAVRFGNVLGSNGSVIPLFKEQIKKGGPVTVTHRDIIRYFMTIPEAVSLVLQAGGFAKCGEIFVLDMGEPVRILELAENLIRLMGYTPYEDIDIVYTGLRPGEKLFEEVLTDEEGLQKTRNDKIYVGHQSNDFKKDFEKDLNNLITIAFENDREGVLSALKYLIPTFKHAKNHKKVFEAKNKEILSMQKEIKKARSRKSEKAEA